MSAGRSVTAEVRARRGNRRPGKGSRSGPAPERATKTAGSDGPRNVRAVLNRYWAATGEPAGTARKLSSLAVQLVEEFKTYAFQVRDLVQLTGMTCEDSSRMVQIARRLQIPQGEMQLALWFVSRRDGTPMDLDTLTQIADELEAIEPGAKQRFLWDRFGQSGMEIGRFLGLGGQAARQLLGALDPKLTLTKYQVNQAVSYSMAVNRLNRLLESSPSSEPDAGQHDDAGPGIAVSAATSHTVADRQRQAEPA